ncbi:MAG TPA: hypothetical protein VF026_11805 [Ktedonobacteraceae bacterium]
MVRLRTADGWDLVNGRAALLQGHGLGRATVVGQPREQRIAVLQAARAGEATVGAALQVVALIGDGCYVSAVAPRVVGHDASADVDRAAVDEAAAFGAGGVTGEGAVADRRCATVVEAAAGSGGGVTGEGAVADRHCAEVVEAAPDLGGIAAECAVADRHRAALVVEEGPAFAEGRVEGEGAVADRHRATVVVETAAAEEAAAARGAMSNGKSREDEADAAVHGQDLYAVAAIEGDALPAAIQGHAPGDRERTGEGDIPTTTEGDGVASVLAVGLADRGVQVGLIAGTDRNGGGSMRRAGQPACHHAQADEQAQPQHEAQPGRPTKGVWLIHHGYSFPPLSTGA